MPSLCSLAALMLALTAPADCKSPDSGVTTANYVAGLPAVRPDFAFGMPKAAPMPRMPRPKWP